MAVVMGSFVLSLWSLGDGRRPSPPVDRRAVRARLGPSSGLCRAPRNRMRKTPVDGHRSRPRSPVYPGTRRSSRSTGIGHRDGPGTSRPVPGIGTASGLSPCPRGLAATVGPHDAQPRRKDAEHGKAEPGDKAPGSPCPTRTGRRSPSRTSPASGWSSTSTRGTTRRAAPRRPASSTTTSGPSPGPRCPSSGSPPTAPRSTGRSGPSTGSSSRCSPTPTTRWARPTGPGGRRPSTARRRSGSSARPSSSGGDGKVVRPWYHVKADGHADKVLAELDA